MGFLRDFHDLLQGAGVLATEEPKAACARRRCRQKVASSRRLYFAFSRPQTCAFCGESVDAGEALAFE